MLHEAIGVSRLDILETLIPAASNLDVSALGFNPLTQGEDNGVGSPAEFAAQNGNVKALRRLLEAGAKPSDAALYRAIKTGHPDAVKMLVSNAHLRRVPSRHSRSTRSI